MPNPENIKPHEFKKGQSGNPNGRPKKFVSAVLGELKKEGYTNITRRQVIDIYETLVTLPESKLKEIMGDLTLPIIYRKVAKEILSNRGFDVIERMLDRTQGKPVQKQELSGADDGPVKCIIEFIGGDDDKDSENQVS